MVVNSIKGVISLSLVCCIAGLRFNFENVGDYQSAQIDSGLISIWLQALCFDLFFVAPLVLSWFRFTYVTAVHVSDKEFIRITSLTHLFYFAIQVLVAVIVWIHFV
jgi:hypothetical protein